MIDPSSEKQAITGKEYVERKVALDAVGGLGCLGVVLVPITGIAIYLGWYNPWLIGITAVVIIMFVWNSNRAFSKMPLDRD